MKKILVCGGREYKDIDFLTKVLDLQAEESFVFIIQGGARGADYLAKVWAKNTGHPFAEVPAQWAAYGKKAGYIRNCWMLELEPDLVIAFPGGRGTEMMCDLASKRNVPVQRYYDNK